jgi:hypothetical protein
MSTPTHSPFHTTDLLTTLGIDPNQQYVPVRAVLRQLGFAPTSYEKALRRIPILAAGLKALWLTDAQGQRTPALCLRVDLLPLWLCTLPAARQPILAQWQHEAASILWQQSKPNGASPADALGPATHAQSNLEVAYTQTNEAAAVARQQLLAERTLDWLVLHSDDPSAARLADPQTEVLVRAIRQTAMVSATLSKRNDYLGIFLGLVRVFQITSLRLIPPARIEAALEWLTHWRTDIEADHQPSTD